MSVKCTAFGALSTGEKASLFTISNGAMSIAVSDYGATWVQANVPSRSGGIRDVLLGFEDAGQYERGNWFFGSTVGRFANRIGGAAFSLDGAEYKLQKNDGPNCLHGGNGAWNARMWQHEILEDGVRFTLESPDGDLGFPGRVLARASYRLTADNGVAIEWEAETSKPTPINMTNHAYFNLKGEGQGDVLGHRIQMKASRSLEVDSHTLPTGKILPVKGGPLDFLEEKELGKDIGKLPIGYDNCLVLDRNDAGLAKIGEVFEPESGRRMAVSATQPAIQLYSGFYIASKTGKDGHSYPRFSGFCLETQDYPDAPNHPSFPDCVLRPGKTYRHAAVYAFSW